MNDGMTAANANFEKALVGQGQIVEGLNALIAGIEAQQEGLNQLADGQGQIVNHFPTTFKWCSSH